MDLNKLAIVISRKEGLKHELSIAQIKETIRCLVEVIAEEINEKRYSDTVDRLDEAGLKKSQSLKQKARKERSK